MNLVWLQNHWWTVRVFFAHVTIFTVSHCYAVTKHCNSLFFLIIFVIQEGNIDYFQIFLIQSNFRKITWSIINTNVYPFYLKNLHLWPYNLCYVFLSTYHLSTVYNVILRSKICRLVPLEVRQKHTDFGLQRLKSKW